MYDPALIKKHTWPAPQQMPDGRWRRVWTIQLREPLSVSTTAGAISFEIAQQVFKDLTTLDPQLENLGNELSISLEFVNPQELILALTTAIQDWPEEMLFASWCSFQNIDQMVGTIDTIEGQARDHWPPWNFSAFQNPKSKIQNQRGERWL